MESGTKERLTGAIILGALMVYFVPEIFHGQRNGLTSAPARPAPANTSDAMRSYTLDLGDKGAGNVQGTVAARPVTPPTAVPGASPPPPPVAQAGSAPGKSGWVVQLGIFGQYDNALRMQSVARSKGFDTSVLGPDAAGHYRVGVVGLADSNAAASMVERLKAAGMEARATAAE